jgi:N-acyl-D-amino-acid deacylase
MAKSYDLVVRGGRLIDGTGSPARAADVAIRGDAIAEVGAVAPAEETPVLDVSGLTVAPGFVDAWAAADPLAPVLPGAESKLLQGVTTEVEGAGARFPFPLAEGATAPLDGIDPALVGPGWPGWTDAPGFFVELARAGTGVNRALTAGYGQIRAVVVGPSDTNPTRDEAKRIAKELGAALEAGCVGLSVDLSRPPDAYASPEQLVELGRLLADAGAPLALGLRDVGPGLEEAVEEALGVARRAGVDLVLPNLRVGPTPHWGKIDWLERRLTAAIASGTSLCVTVEPYVAWAGPLVSVLPPGLAEGGPEVAAQKLAGQVRREEALRSLEARAAGDEGYWGRVVLPRRAEAAEGSPSIAELASERKSPPAEVAVDLVIEDPWTEALFFELNEGVLARMIGWEFAAIGSGEPARPLADGRLAPPLHPRALGAGLRVLRRYCREKKAVALDEAVRRMTSLPAERFRLGERGRVAPGCAADLVVFRAESVADRASFADPTVPPAGVEHVVVGGRFAVRDGSLTGVRPGRVLRRS